MYARSRSNPLTHEYSGNLSRSNSHSYAYPAGSGPASPIGAHGYRRTLSQRGSLGSGGVEHGEGYGYNSEWAAEGQRFRRSPSNVSRSPLPSTVRATSPRRTSRDLHIAAATLAKELSGRMNIAAGGYGGRMDEGPLQVNETGGAALES